MALGPNRVFGKTEDYAFLRVKKVRQIDKMKTEDFSKFSTCEDWKMKISRKCEA